MTETLELDKDALLFRPTELRGLWKRCGVRPIPLHIFLYALFKNVDPLGQFYPHPETKYAEMDRCV
jgi:hypothetical protein